MSIVLTLTDPSLLASLEPLGDISDILNPITENVISVNIIPCIRQLSVLEITSYLCYICLWRINLQSALSARHRQTHMSFACKGYQFLWPYHSLQRSIFCSPLSGQGTHWSHTVSKCVKFCCLGDFAVCLFLSAIVLKSSRLSILPIWSWFFRGSEWFHEGDNEFYIFIYNHAFRLKVGWGGHNAMGAVEMWHLLGKWSLGNMKEWQAELKLRSTKELAVYHTCHLSSSSMLLANSVHKHSYQNKFNTLCCAKPVWWDTSHECRGIRAFLWC